MRAIIAKRVDSGTPDTTEISDLAAAAGYTVAGEVTQSRRADPALQLGEGKAEELAEVVEATEATTVIFDNRLGPYQTYNLGQLLPEGVEVIDRFTLILEIFGQRAQTRKAQLQVELAELRYELPRAEAKTSLAKRDEHPGFMGLGEYDESREQDIKNQISRINDELERIEQTEEHRRERRRDSGFDLVALAGYTNAGKSTLLRRLSEDLDVDENEDLHQDLDATAESQDKLFTTLGTTTRRAAIEPRDVLVTDTVGFISDLPHWLVESFKSTLDSVYRADLVLLVVDVSEDVDDIHEKLVTSHDTLYERNEAPIVTVLNKIDAVDEAELEEKREALSALAPNPVTVSAQEGQNIDALLDRIDDELPDWEEERLMLPMTDETMSVVSWIHDNAHVDDVTYGDEDVLVSFEARPAVISQARTRASELQATVADSA
ncbi:GTP-binding protein HflX [Natrialba magadii ATCC 43099]|uniref:GTPase HflX n=1 Tax=Natrialba magadii (strain ATCC 43099 / DSM 3394 / CCM 3739 / CIP 104546 / IAM 13178 / JCM 8861 / NBRC 102185 / NCIMB 2190 / MS3) TaxID=547559 RepID=D3SSM3_NATMM|nr:GTPase HflX [Natrialba magadii]ADD06868.1 GTP-binding protein HflX [Natrialba magadii ATCC 43099]ELY28406.1 GTP-binding proten HflX [Natrialba magadii ATCC 43099]